MRPFYTFILCAFSYSAFAQITLTDKNKAQQDQGFEIHFESTNPTGYELEMEKPEGHSWDLTGLSLSNNPTTGNYGNPAFTGFSNEFKDAEIAVLTNGAENGYFLSFDGPTVQVVGQGKSYIEFIDGQMNTVRYPLIFDTPLELYTYPVKMGAKSTSSASYETNLVAYGGMGTAKSTMNMEVEVDGYGSMKMPNGTTLDVLRVKITEVDTLGQFDVNRVTYEYRAEEYSWPLVKFSIEDEGEMINFFWLNVDKAPNGIGDNSLVKSTAYPNPSSGLIRLDNLDGPHSFVVYDLGGRIVEKGTTSTGAIDLQNLENGSYMLKVEDRESSVVWGEKITILKK